MLASALFATSVHAQALPVPPEPPTPTLPSPLGKPPSSPPTAANDPSYGAKAGKLGTRIGKLGKLGARLGKLANPYGLAGQYAFDKLMNGIDDLLAQVRGPLGHSAPDNISAPPKSDYPIVYIFDEKQFGSPSELKSYILGEYLRKRSLKTTRNKEGLYYQHLYLDYQNNCYACQGFGHFRFYVQVGYIGSYYEQNIGGSLDAYTGIIAYDGKVDTQDVVNPAQAQLKNLIDEYENAIQNEPVQNPQTQSNDESNPSADTNHSPNAKPNNNPKPNANPKPNTQPDSEPSNNPKPSEKKDEKENPRPNDRQQSKDKDKQEPKPFELPEFCDWASVVCKAIDDAREWSEDNSDKDTQLDITEHQKDDIKTKIDFDGRCPANVELNLAIFGKQTNITLFEWSKFCSFLEFLKPIVIAIASYQAVRIIGGVNVAD